MTKIERMQRLHHLAATGHALNAADAAALGDWYAALDADEAIINQQNHFIETKELREKVAATAAQITAVSQEVAQILAQNEVLRRENAVLRQELEVSLTKQAA